MSATALFDIFKKKGKTSGLYYAPTNSGALPFFSPFGESVYASDIVMQAIRCKANEFKKLDPRHIRTIDGNETVVNDSSIARALQRPTPWMTTADFLEKITILLELNKNVFIYPMYYMTKGGERYYTGLYPLKPSSAEYMADDSGNMFIHFRFQNGYEITLPIDSVIHWRKDYGVNDYFGGGMFGGDDNAGLLKVLKQYDMLTQSIAKALEVSCQLNGLVKYNSYNDTEALEKNRQDFEQRLKNNQSGFLFCDLKTEYTKLDRDVKLVDAETLKFFYETILRNVGTPLCILNGDYTKAQKEAWYESSLEGDIKNLGQSFSRIIFSDREQSFGNAIVCYPNDLLFMTMENKIAYMQVAVPAGAMSVNQILKFGGLPPIDGGDDIRPRGYNELDGNKTNGSEEG